MTGSFNACNNKNTYLGIGSIVVQKNTMMVQCFGNTYFYTGNGSSFSYLSGITTLQSSSVFYKGAYVDLNNQLVVTDQGKFVRWYL